MADRSRGQFAAYAAVVLLALVAGGRYLLSGGAERPEGPPRVALDGVAPGASASRRGGSARRRPRLFVHVAGEVRQPGVYRVTAGARVGSAVARAGGASGRAELAAVNLAAPLQDGQQVIVPQRGAAAAPPGGPAGSSGGAAGDATGSSGAAGTGGAPVSLSQATTEQLDALDGIGPTLAARILEYRDAHGGFRSLEQLREVEGIGEKRFESLRDAVRP